MDFTDLRAVRRLRCATAIYRQSTTVRAAIRLAVAPERNAVSRAAVVRTRSTDRASGDRGKLVIATVRAPLAFAMAIAKAKGARTVAITNFPLSPLARSVDLVLTTAARETALRSGATASRIAALTVVDCLYIAVAQRNLRTARKSVKSTRDAVSSHQVGNYSPS